MAAIISCIIDKSFLVFWKYKVVRHDFKMHRISKFMDVSKDFQVEWKCSKCGLSKEESFVTNDELLLQGIPQDVLNKIDSWNWHFMNKTTTP